MNLHILFGQRKQSYAGEHAPEPLLCWSEYEIEENPEGFDQEVLEKTKKAESDFSAVRLIVVEVDQDKIARLLNEPPTVKGTVCSDE